ncbi:MAG: pyridoxamine 5'-phosphate oxidase family protein [Tissierellia bacterium]|nr:pyridoxamine 5'-phosphate oxidase family protein [Tissierellia bacterium]
MFRKMRRVRQLLDTDFAKDALNRGSSGVLSVHGDDGYPYGVPLSYVYHDGKLYFHTATSGHKLDAIKNNDKVSFTVILQDNLVAEKFTSYFMSVIAFGRARVIEDEEEKRKTISILSDRYFPEMKEESYDEINSTFDRFHMIEMTIEHITGKQAIELVNDGNQ